MKKFALLIVVSLIILSGNSIRPFAAERETHVTLEAPCSGYDFRGRCQVLVKIEGPITRSDAETFRSILDSEAGRTGKVIEPTIAISSVGGDVQAAMLIGRDLRRTEGFILSYQMGPCYSACVLIAAGAVKRVMFDIGIHRPYFADSSASSLAEADARYKKLMGDVRSYLTEMNISDEVFHMMENIAPDEIRRLNPEETKRLGFLGNDPAYEELDIANKARAYHLSSVTYRQRLAGIDRSCGKVTEATTFEEMLKRQGCAGKLMDIVMWDADPSTLARINAKIDERCKRLSDSPRWSECSGDVGFATKQGFLTKLPDDFAGWLKVPVSPRPIVSGRP